MIKKTTRVSNKSTKCVKWWSMIKKLNASMNKKDLSLFLKQFTETITRRLLCAYLSFFSRSYCYTVWSAIGISLLSVRPSVCPSVRLSVTLCIVALRVGVEGWKLFQRAPSINVPICPFWHFCSRMYRLATKRDHKKTREREREFSTTTCIAINLLTVTYWPNSVVVSHAWVI